MDQSGGGHEQSCIWSAGVDPGKARITGTPTFVLGKTTDNVVNGARLVGAQPLAAFEGHLQKLLKKAEVKSITN